MNALLHRLDAMEKQAIDNKERIDVLQCCKETLTEDNKRLTALADNKDVRDSDYNLIDFFITFL